MRFRVLELVCVFGLAGCGSNTAADASSADATPPVSPAAGAKAPASEAIAPSAIFPYLNVKSWSGTVTAEASDTSEFLGVKSVSTYTATGDVTLVDESVPNPPHAVWPQPTPADLADPKKSEIAYKRWTAHVTYTLHKTGVGDLGDKVDATCTAEGDELGLVQVMMVPTGSQYWLNVEPPPLRNVQCTGTSVLPVTGGFPITYVKIDGNVGGPTDPISGVSDQPMGNTKAKITYKLTPK